MTDHDNSEKAADSYAVAFRIGLVGSIILMVAAVMGDKLAALLALVIWSLVTLFGLPLFYVWWCDVVPTISYQLLRGPQQ